MEKTEFDELVKEIGVKAATEFKQQTDALEQRLNETFQKVKDDSMTKEAFDKFKEEELTKVNEALKSIQDAAKTQGETINKLMSGKEGRKGYRSIEQIVKDNAEDLKKIFKQGHGVIEVNLAEEAGISALKAVGVIGVSTSINAMDSPPSSPYAPGIGGGSMNVFDIRNNPNFIMNYVDMGRTNQYRLAWINEIAGEGAVAEVAEGAAKPQLDIDFKVEISEAKKIAGMIKITEEFESDLPQLETQVRRLLMEKTVRGFDDALYAAIIAAATGFTTTDLDDEIDAANLWDAVGALAAQVGVNNYTPNMLGLNPITNFKIASTKNADALYVAPPYATKLQNILTESNKVAVDKGLVGDLSQYKVDIYKDFTLKMGWNNDDFQRNQFSVVCEVRYHRYISDNRKKAIVYADLPTVQAQILKPVV